MRRTITAACAAALLATLTACSSGGDRAPEAKPSATSTPSPTPSYTFEDCKELLEYDYQAGQPKDASKDPECAHLTPKQYTEAVGEVLAGHKDEIMDQAAREVRWDRTWDFMAADNRAGLCHHIRTSGVDTVGQALTDAGAESENDAAAMAQYFLDNKC